MAKKVIPPRDLALTQVLLHGLVDKAEMIGESDRMNEVKDVIDMLDNQPDENFITVKEFLETHHNVPIINILTSRIDKIKGIGDTMARIYRDSRLQDPRKGSKGDYVYPISFLQAMIPLLVLEKVYGIKSSFISLVDDKQRTSYYDSSYIK